MLPHPVSAECSTEYSTGAREQQKENERHKQDADDQGSKTVGTLKHLRHRLCSGRIGNGGLLDSRLQQPPELVAVIQPVDFD